MNRDRITCDCGAVTRDYYVGKRLNGHGKGIRIVRCRDCEERAIRDDARRAVYGSKARVKVAWRSEGVHEVLT